MKNFHEIPFEMSKGFLISSCSQEIMVNNKNQLILSDAQKKILASC